MTLDFRGVSVYWPSGEDDRMPSDEYVKLLDLLDRQSTINEKLSAALAAIDQLDDLRAAEIRRLQAQVAGLEAREQARQDKALDAVVRDPESWQAVAEAGRRAK